MRPHAPACGRCPGVPLWAVARFTAKQCRSKDAGGKSGSRTASQPTGNPSVVLIIGLYPFRVTPVPTRFLPMRRFFSNFLACCGAAIVVAGTAAVPAAADVTPKKAMWGPIEVRGQSQFPIYEQLGVGIFQWRLDW